MTYKLVIEEARSVVDEALKKLGFSASQYTLLKPPSEQLGDLSCNVAFQVAKSIGGRPGDVAEKVAGIIDRSRLNFVSKVTHHASGYVNFFLNMKELAGATLRSIAFEESYGFPEPKQRLRISVEHTSVNPAHPLHIGHLRNVVIGDSLARILKACGHQVYVLNYIDDTGLQVATALLGILELGIKPEPPEGVKVDHYIGDIYVETNRRIEKEPALEVKRKKVSEQLERGNGQVPKTAAEIVEKVVRAQLATCWRIGAEYDLLNFESQVLKTGLWETVFSRLKEMGIVKLAKGGKFDGCWVMEGGDENEEEKVLVRSDGTAVYAAKDIPYAAWKLGMLRDPFRYKLFAEQRTRKLWATAESEGREPPTKFNEVDKTISVIGVEQSRPQKFVKAALMALGPRGSGYHHLAYGKVSLSASTARQIEAGITDNSPVSMKGRTGVYVTADDALNALKKKASEETRKRNQGADTSWIQETAESIAVAAIRYELVKQDLNKPIVFDMDEALRLEGDTGPYLMYSYARARSVVKKAGYSQSEKPHSFFPPVDLERSEKNLILELSRTEIEVEEALNYLNPRVVANHAFSLAMSFNVFYERCPILAAPDANLRDWRLLVTESFSKVLGRLMELIGIQHLESI